MQKHKKYKPYREERKEYYKYGVSQENSGKTESVMEMY